MGAEFSWRGKLKHGSWLKGQNQPSIFKPAVSFRFRAAAHSDCIITDQPYGTGWIRGGGKQAGEFKRRKETAPWDVFDLAWMDKAPARVAAFCPVQGVWEMCQRLPRPHLLKYRKTNPAPYGAKCEPIVSSHAMPKEWEKEAYNGDNSLHPCQKPLDLMAWLVDGLTAPGETVCDPFMGSGSTGVVCVRYGRRFIGIEQDAANFEVARKRLEAEVAQGTFDFGNGAGAPMQNVSVLGTRHLWRVPSNALFGFICLQFFPYDSP